MMMLMIIIRVYGMITVLLHVHLGSATSPSMVVVRLDLVAVTDQLIGFIVYCLNMDQMISVFLIEEVYCVQVAEQTIHSLLMLYYVYLMTNVAIIT